RRDPRPQAFINLPRLRHARSTSKPETLHRTTSPIANELETSSMAQARPSRQGLMPEQPS
ncbi:hypothetical protein, partial [Glycomyces harbinensis]|uniref:hypothetical protein n=1 Tax=Glycomyces harbinensis TaxID=58114 RepID=UPI0024DE0081